MSDFKTAYAPLKQYEGGYANNPADRGGETYAGIARKFYPGWPGWATVDRVKKGFDSVSTVNRLLAAEPHLSAQVEDFYRTEWWDKLGLAALPQTLADEIFEQAVNLGKAGAGRYVQRLCNAFNSLRGEPLFQDLKEDGSIGPQTLAALCEILKTRADTDTLVHALNALQAAHYIALAANSFSQRQFLNGWLKRTH